MAERNHGQQKKLDWAHWSDSGWRRMAMSRRDGGPGEVADATLGRSQDGGSGWIGAGRAPL
ncbi:hypothetical protein CCMA1212_006127 [Trichoderma ghanense]|uniref:Uncharacterized protein n=1 Tax=Trichoderma ghanense TaxID=65468 RepID=A0ABY2H3V0_9HYPO